MTTASGMRRSASEPSDHRSRRPDQGGVVEAEDDDLLVEAGARRGRPASSLTRPWPL